MVEGDIPYIYSSWLEDFLSSHHIKLKDQARTLQTSMALMPRELYFKEQRAKINRIIAKSIVYVACNKEDESQIFGYAVTHSEGSNLELNILSWIYVKPIYRKLGICNLLMTKIGQVDLITHLPPSRRWFLKKYQTIFNPYKE